MGLTSILRGLGVMLIAIGLAMFGPMILSLRLGEGAAGSFLFGAVLSLACGGAAVAASLGRQRATDFRGVLMIVLLGWAVLPAFAAVPLVNGSMTFWDAYFEAVSAITTTGAWLSLEGALSTKSGILWRAELQWLGGLASLTTAAAIFIRPAFIGIDTLLPPFSRGEHSSYLRPLQNAALAFLPVYCLITLIAFIVVALAGAPVLDSAAMAMSLVATGGFIPHENGINGYPPMVGAVVFPLLLLGGANFIVISNLFAGGSKRVRDIESGAYMLIVVWAGVLFWLVAGAGSLATLPVEFFNAASAISTNGFMIGEPPTLIVALVTAIIGGAAVSTAGGFKILRWLVITRRAREEVRRLAAPNAVFGSRKVSNELGVWMHFLVFTFTLGALVVSFSIGGHPLDVSAAAATAALSNAGPLLSLANGGNGDYAIFEPTLRAVLIVGMILGRLEAAAALALINFAFWRG